MLFESLVLSPALSLLQAWLSSSTIQRLQASLTGGLSRFITYYECEREPDLDTLRTNSFLSTTRLTTFSAGGVITRDEISEPVLHATVKWQATLRKSIRQAGAPGETVIEETLVSEFQASRTGDLGAGRWWRAIHDSDMLVLTAPLLIVVRASRADSRACGGFPRPSAFYNATDSRPRGGPARHV